AHSRYGDATREWGFRRLRPNEKASVAVDHPAQFASTSPSVQAGAKETIMSRQYRSGFTLVELLIVVVILAILAAAVIPTFTDSTTDARASTALTNLNVL